MPAHARLKLLGDDRVTRMSDTGGGTARDRRAGALERGRSGP